MAEEAKYYVFYHRVPNATVIFPDGAIATFPGGKFATKEEDRAAFLLGEIKKGNIHIFIDEQKFEVTEKDLDPLAELKARIIAEYEAEKAASGQADAGTSEQGKLKTVTSQTVGGAAVNSSSGTQGLTIALKQPAAAPQ